MVAILSPSTILLPRIPHTYSDSMEDKTVQANEQLEFVGIIQSQGHLNLIFGTDRGFCLQKHGSCHASY